MIKTFALIVRRPDHSREAFREHYESTHAPMAIPLMQGLGRYVRYHVCEEIHGTPVFDVISGFWYATGEDAAATVARVESEEGEAIRADELGFMDKARNEILLVQPRNTLVGDEGSEPLFVLVRAPEREGPERDAWLADYDAKHAPRLALALDAPTSLIEHDAVATTPGPPSWDRITQVASAGLGALRAWIAEIESAGGGVCALRTRAHETETAWELPA